MYVGLRDSLLVIPNNATRPPPATLYFIFSQLKARGAQPPEVFAQRSLVEQRFYETWPALKDSVGTLCLDEQGQPHKLYRVVHRQGVCICNTLLTTSYAGAGRGLVSLIGNDVCPVITVGYQ